MADRLYNKYLIPPVGGENLSSPLTATPENQAVMIRNWFCEDGYLRARLGYDRIYENVGVSQIPCNLKGVISNTGSTLWVTTTTTGPAGNFYVYNASTLLTGSTVTAASMYSLGQTEFKTSSGNNLMVFATGANSYTWDLASGSVSAVIGWTGATLNAACVGKYKGRLYFGGKLAPKVQYAAVDSVAGTLYDYDFSGYVTQGYSSIIWCGGLNGDTHGPIQQLFGALSEAGEFLVWTGDYPGSTTWSIVGKANLGVIPQQNAVFDVAGEAHVTTLNGIINLNAVVRNGMRVDSSVFITEDVRACFPDVTSTYRYRQSFWCADKHMLLVPGFVSGTTTGLLVQNTNTKAWSAWTSTDSVMSGPGGPMFIVGGTASTVYCANYGDIGGGNYTQVYMLDKAATTTDENAIIDLEIWHRWEDLGDPKNLKRVSSVRPLINFATNDVVNLGVAREFVNGAQDETAYTVAPEATGAVNQKEFAVARTGHYLSFRVRSAGYHPWQYQGMIAQYQTGGVF